MANLLDNLVAYWKMEEASGTRVDATGNGNDLTDNNTVTQNPGRVGNAAQFTSANSETLSRVSNASLSTGDVDYTWAGWVYADTVGTFRAIATKQSGGSNYDYTIYINGSTRFAIYNGASVAATAFGAPAPATWYFVVAWHDSVAHTNNISINDGTVASAGDSGIFAATSGGLTLGADGASSYWNGRIDEIGLWKRVLTAAERTALYNGGNGTTYPFGIIQVGVGSLSVSGNALGLQTQVSPAVGTVTVTGNATAAQKTITLPVASVVVSGNAPGLNGSINAPPGSVIITGQVPVPAYSYSPAAGSISFAGAAPRLQELLGVPSGALALNGLSLSQFAYPQVGSLSFSGFIPVPRVTPISPASLLFAGLPPVVYITRPGAFSRPRPLLHPQLRNIMPEQWPSSCAIQTVTYTVSASNQHIPSGAAVVAGMRSIPCRLAPIIDDRPTDNEVREQNVLEQYVRRRCKLNGYFPTIVPRDMQAVVDGVIYPIRGVEHDSQHFSTRLMLEVIFPHG